MTDTAFQYTAVALAAGMGAQVIATRLAIPSIVLLLVAGVLLGPDVAGLLDPTVFRGARSDLVTLAVTVILFEGALALDRERLHSLRGSLGLLLTVGALISAIVGTLAAHLLIGLPWPVATLYGTIVIVTGPTVVTPLLARLSVDRPVRELLVSEGVLIDPIGAIVALVAAEAVLGLHDPLTSPVLVLWRLAVGAAIGAAAGLALARVLRARVLPDDLVNPVVLGAVLLVAAIASRVSPEAGLMAAVAQGVVLGNARLRELRRLQAFKEALTLILLSFLFVVLAADLRLQAIADLGWPALGVVAALAWVARPLAVFTCTAGSDLSWKQRAFVAWICPRGIVAAAVAGLFALWLGEADIAGATRLEALVFVTVAATVTLQGLTAGRVAHWLGVDVPTAIGTMVIGADRLGCLLAQLLVMLGRQVVLIDRSALHCRRARAEHLPVLEGDALSVDTLEEAGARYADTVISLTANAQLNELLATRVRNHFTVERVFALTEDGNRQADEQEPRPFPGNFPGVDEANRLLRLGRLRVVEYEVPRKEKQPRRLDALPYAESEFALLVLRGGRALVATAQQEIGAGDHLWCVRPAKTSSPLGNAFVALQEADPRMVVGRR